MKQILIRADDLGFSNGVNQGIEKTLQNGLVKSVGLMTNMDEAENGVRMVRQYDVCIGQHTNICVGKPLTDPKLIPSICQKMVSSNPARNIGWQKWKEEKLLIWTK